MKIIKGKIHQDFSRDLYWARLDVQSDDGKLKTAVFTCASHEYLWDTLKKKDFTDEETENVWLDKVAEFYSSQGPSIFNNQIHYHVKATTQEGEQNGYEFLKKDL